MAKQTKKVKRKINEFFKKSIDAKSKKLDKFEYKGKTYFRQEKGPLVFYSSKKVKTSTKKSKKSKKK